MAVLTRERLTMKTVRSNKLAKIAASVALGLGVVAGANAVDETFKAQLRILSPITITEDQLMDFGETAQGIASDIAATDANNKYASFTVDGDDTKTATASVVETSIEMLTGDGVGTTKRVTVDTFSVGVGSSAGGDQLNFASGPVADVRVYGTAHQEAEDIAGLYTGDVTFRVVYN